MCVKSDKSYKSRSSIFSRSDCEKISMNPETDCARRRNPMVKLNQLDVLLVGYKKFIAYQKNINSAFAIQTIQSMKESQAARDLLVSELRTIPPCVDPDCPDHSSLESKNNETIEDNVKINELDKKKTLKNGKILRIIRTTLSFRVKRLDPPRKLQYLNLL
ncbi:hypothetical protein TNCV_4666081 [Trichonephila clavipes]|nr:hypothetical protein TNCV_4666081 [Trichonephila clavipes]